MYTGSINMLSRDTYVCFMAQLNASEEQYLCEWIWHFCSCFGLANSFIYNLTYNCTKCYRSIVCVQQCAFILPLLVVNQKAI